MLLLTRDEFRQSVLSRDNHKCVICKEPAQDAHHIIERRLWSDGGYYIDNGASLCGKCHLKAESTELSCEQIRSNAGIKAVILPEHLYRDTTYDKWGNIVNEDGSRTPGELFQDRSVQKALHPIIHLFRKGYIKYPRTYHLPQSPGATKDDRVLTDVDIFANKMVVITEKMDGENTTIYSDGYCHARSIDSKKHPSRSWVKNLAQTVGYNLPTGWRICGENLWAKHSIQYDNLEDYFLAFSLWDDNNECLSWGESLEYFYLLDLKHVPIIYTGPFTEDMLERLCEKAQQQSDEHEGFVIRVANKFHYSQFRQSVAKWVRPSHVQSTHNWMRESVTRNKKGISK